MTALPPHPPYPPLVTPIPKLTIPDLYFRWVTFRVLGSMMKAQKYKQYHFSMVNFFNKDTYIYQSPGP